MSVEIYMPRLGLTMQEGTIVTWIKREGEPVAKGDSVVEIVSEKIANVVEAQGTGVMGKILFAEGTTVPSGTVIGYIKEAGDEEAGDTGDKETGDAGAEIKNAAPDTAGETSAGIQAGGADSNQSPAGNGHDLAGGGQNPIKDAGGPELKETIPLTGIRKVIADRMAESLHRSPQATVTMRVDMSGLAALKEEHASAGLKYSYTDYMVKIAALALRENPLLNSSVRDGQILVYRTVNIGVAVAADASLTVPVIKDVLNKNLAEISGEVRDLAQRARDGKLEPEELRGGTFTFSNMGMFHVDVMTPILNPPEAAILALGTAKREVVVAEDDSWQIRPMAALSLTIDHAALDGMPAAKFLETVSGIIADPGSYLV